MRLVMLTTLVSSLFTQLSLALAVTQGSSDLATLSSCTCPSGDAPEVTVMRTITNTQTIYNTTSSVTAYQVVLLVGNRRLTTTSSRAPSSTTTVTQTLHSTAYLVGNSSLLANSAGFWPNVTSTDTSYIVASTTSTSSVFVTNIATSTANSTLTQVVPVTQFSTTLLPPSTAVADVGRNVTRTVFSNSTLTTSIVYNTIVSYFSTTTPTSTEYDYPTDSPDQPGLYGPVMALEVRGESPPLYCNAPSTVTIVEETTTTLSESTSASMSQTTTSSMSISFGLLNATMSTSLLPSAPTSSISMSFGSLNATMSTPLLSSASGAVDCPCDIVAARAVAAPNTVYVTQTTNIIATAAVASTITIWSTYTEIADSDAVLSYTTEVDVTTIPVASISTVEVPTTVLPSPILETIYNTSIITVPTTVTAISTSTTIISEPTSIGACPYSNNLFYGASNGATFQMFCDLGYAEIAHVIALQQTSDMQTCMESCRVNTECAAVTFMETNCTFLRTLDATQAMPGAVSANITDVVVNTTTTQSLMYTSTISDFGGTKTASIATVTALVPTCALVGNNMIQNGDFECDLAPADSYNVFYWDGTDGVYVAAVSPGSGNSAQAVSLSCDIGSMITPIWQTLIGASSPPFMLSFDYMVANVSSVDSVTLHFDSYSTSTEISAGGASNVDSNNNALYTWHSMVLAWQLSDGQPELDIFINCNMPDSFGTFLIDNVAITALLPQPAGACDPQGDNLIGNGDFESDRAPTDPVDIWCWTSIGTGSAVPVSPGYGSTQAVSMTEGALLQSPEVELINGRQYTISLYYYAPINGEDDSAAGAPVTINICSEYVPILSTSEAESGWMFATIAYRATYRCVNGGSDVRVSAQSDILIDDFYIVLQPFGTCDPNSNNLLLNGDFECDDDVDYDTDIIGWYPYSDGTPVQAVMSYDENPSSQVAALSCQAATIAEIIQTINTPTIIGATYTFTLDYSWSSVAVDTPGGVALRVQAGGGSSNNNFLLLVPDGSTSSSWATQDGTFTATDSSTTLTLTLTCNENSNAELYLDNLIIPPVAAPDPSSPQPPTCTATNYMLINGDFECDDAADFQYTIPGWDLDTSDPSASVTAITSGDDNSAQAVALSCGNSMTGGASIAQISQYVNIPLDGTYQMTFSYYWNFVEDGSSGVGFFQALMGGNELQSSVADGNIGVWTTATVNGQMPAGEYDMVSFTLICEQGFSGISAPIWIDDVSVAPPPPTCAANPNEILMNGDFECDDAQYYPTTILGWVVTSDGSASAQAITPGYDTSAQAVALSCDGSMAESSSFVELSQDFALPFDWPYDSTFMYNWESVSDGVQLFYGLSDDGSPNAVGTGIGTGSWQAGGANANLEYPASLSFMLYCPADVSGPATVWIDVVSVLPAPPTCAANPNDILMNGDFECDDAEYYPLIIPGWDVTTSSASSALVEAITPGYSDSAQAVALSCDVISGYNSFAQLSQYFTAASDAAYQLTFDYYWEIAADGVQFSYGLGDAGSDSPSPYNTDSWQSMDSPYNTGSWQSIVITADLTAGNPADVSFYLDCSSGTVNGASTLLWLDDVSVIPAPEILINGDFESDDAADFPFTIPGWEVESPDGSIQAITPGDNSARAISLSCGAVYGSTAQINQNFFVPSDGRYEVIFNYNWDTAPDGVAFGCELFESDYLLRNPSGTGYWQTSGTTADLYAGYYMTVSIYLYCPADPDVYGSYEDATIWIDSVVVSLLD